MTPGAKPADDHGLPEADAGADRANVDERLAKLPGNDAKDATPATKALRELLEERRHWLDEWDKAAKERRAAENPEPSPEKLAEGWKADLERVKATLDQTVKEPDALLPASFRNLPAVIPEPVRAEMKEAIDAAQAELKDWSARLEQFRSDASRKASGPTAEARARRDKTHQNLAGLKARNLEREAALAEAKTPESRQLAREKISNGQWETRVEAEWLRGQEAALALEARRSELAGLNLQLLEAHIQLARRTLDRMRERYRAISERQERDLRRAAVTEQTRAERADDPLERYRAKRAAETLELEARVLTSENALTTNPPPSLDEQRALADRAETDFTNVKHLLDDGKISRLDALRLNNDSRRLGPERARIVRHELAAAADRLTAAENALSAIEMEMIYDSRDDRSELDNLLERLPRALHPKAEMIFEDIERRHVALLSRRREALNKLALRAEATHEQVLRRLRILDDHFGFIRTHMFWVRDADPVGLVTLAQVERELQRVARAVLRIGTEVCDRCAWGRLSAEFLTAALGLIVLPWPLRRAQLALRALAEPRPLADDD
jgi:potassium efflux system protein